MKRPFVVGDRVRIYGWGDDHEDATVVKIAENGQILVSDDYRWANTPGVTQAIDEFLRDKPEPLHQATGNQAWIVKQ